MKIRNGNSTFVETAALVQPLFDEIAFIEMSRSACTLPLCHLSERHFWCAPKMNDDEELSGKLFRKELLF